MSASNTGLTALAFLGSLPDVPSPTAALDADGMPTFDWTMAPDRQMSVTVQDDKLICAWVIGAVVGHDVYTLHCGSLPSVLRDKIMDVCL